MKERSLYEVREIKDLKDMLNQSAKLFADKNAFLDNNSSGLVSGITYSQFKNDVDSLGTAFINMGLKDGFIAVIGENRYEWCVTYLATVNGTGVIVPLDKELPEQDIENLLNRSEVSAVIFSKKYSKVMKKLSEKLQTVKYYINMDNANDEDGVLSFRTVLEKGRELLDQGDTSFINAHIDSNKMSILLFTSGTTGFAKGVMLSHSNICANITAVCTTVNVKSSDTSLSILPLHHTYECTLGFLTFIYNGSTIAFNEGLKYISKNLKEVKPTVLITVPLILENMYKKIWEHASKKRGMKTKLKLAMLISNILYNYGGIDIRRKLFKQIHDNFGGNIRLVITGAAAIDPLVTKGLRNLGILVLQGYGLTECSPLVIGNRDRYYVDGAVGLPLPGVEVKVHNINDLGVGEIIVKGPNVMLGYYKDEEATNKCLKDGWFHTGDLGKLDKHGFYYITGRCKNVIVTKNGKNIYPEELESFINRSPFVQESMVWGCYEEKSGETVVNAQIFPNLELIKEKLKKHTLTKDDITAVFNDIIKNINNGMPLYKRIRSFSIRETEFIKTTTKKIKRYKEIAN